MNQTRPGGNRFARRPSPGTLLGALALAVALGGTGLGQATLAGAASRITGHDIKNGSVTGADIKNSSLKGKDLKKNAVGGMRVINRSLTLTDLGGPGLGDQTTTTGSPITVGAGQCVAALTGNFGEAVIGDLVVGTLTDGVGDPVLPNAAAFVPSVVIGTTQGGAVPNLVVCSTGTATLTIPAGSVFHWRLIGA